MKRGPQGRYSKEFREEAVKLVTEERLSVTYANVIEKGYSVKGIFYLGIHFDRPASSCFRKRVYIDKPADEKSG